MARRGSPGAYPYCYHKVSPGNLSAKSEILYARALEGTLTYYYHKVFPGALLLGARRDPAAAPITLRIKFRYHKVSSRTYWKFHTAVRQAGTCLGIIYDK